VPATSAAIGTRVRNTGSWDDTRLQSGVRANLITFYSTTPKNRSTSAPMSHLCGLWTPSSLENLRDGWRSSRRRADRRTLLRSAARWPRLCQYRRTVMDHGAALTTSKEGRRRCAARADRDHDRRVYGHSGRNGQGTRPPSRTEDRKRRPQLRVIRNHRPRHTVKGRGLRGARGQTRCAGLRQRCRRPNIVEARQGRLGGPRAGSAAKGPMANRTAQTPGGGAERHHSAS